MQFLIPSVFYVTFYLFWTFSGQAFLPWVPILQLASIDITYAIGLYGALYDDTLVIHLFDVIAESEVHFSYF